MPTRMEAVVYRAKVDGVLLSFTSDIADDGGRHIFSNILPR